MSRKAIDETGKRYNHLTVIREATEEEFERKAGKGRKWLCRCDCGALTFADGKRTSQWKTNILWMCWKRKSKRISKKNGI